MPLTVIGNEDMQMLLHSLDTPDIVRIQQSLADALHYYSTATDDANGCCASLQPKRSQLKNKDGSTTLFMPAKSDDAMGVKIVTLTEGPPTYNPSVKSSISSASGDSRLGSFSSMSISESSASSQSHRSSLTGSTRVSSDLTESPKASSHDLTQVQTRSSDKSFPSSTSPSGSLTLLDKTGTPRALINAAEITAFRTALASTMLFKKRSNVHDVVIFGAGLQAYWHARLALLLRGDEIHHLTIINRSFTSVERLITKLYKTPWPVEVPHPQMKIITPSASEFDRHLKATLRSASVIFTTTPSLTPLFPHEILTSHEGRRKGRYIASIGSYKPHMLELHPDILKQAVTPHHHHHHHKHAKTSGAVVVDSVEACLKEAGEVRQAGLLGEQLVELGELVMLRRDAELRRRERQGSMSGLDKAGVEIGRCDKLSSGAKESKEGKKDHKEHKDPQEAADASLREWLEKGNVIYKSVGLGLMDVVVGTELVRIADMRGVGTRIDNF